MRAADLIKQYRKIINPPYTGKDIPLLIGTLVILLAIPATVVLVLTGFRFGLFASTSVNIWLEVENGTITSPMQVGSDPNTSNGKYVFTTKSNTSADGGKRLAEEGGQVLSTNGFTLTFDGSPSSPKPIYGEIPNLDITISGDTGKDTVKQYDFAQHGSDCAGPPATHPTTGSYKDVVYMCHNHFMTVGLPNFGHIIFTPAALIDFRNGEAIIRVDRSNFSTSNRDWTNLWITPVNDHLQEPTITQFNPGIPRNGILWAVGSHNGGGRRGTIIRNFQRTDIPQVSCCTGVKKVLEKFGLEVSPKRRDTFEVRLSKDYIKICMPAYDHCFFDTPIDPPLTWDIATIQFSHDTYSATKGTTQNDCSLVGVPCPNVNTWHWDNIEINPALPFTMVHLGGRYIDKQTTFQLPWPAPKNTYFRALPRRDNTTPELSFDGGNTWEKPNYTAVAPDRKEGVKGNIWHRIPEAATSVTIRGAGDRWFITDMSVWALDKIPVEQPPPPPADTTPPTVTFDSPADGSTVSGDVLVKVTATDNESGVDMVNWIIDGTKASSEMSSGNTTETFSFNWDSSSVFDGQHTWGVEVFNNAGLKTSKTITLTTNNGNLPLPTDIGKVEISINVPADGTYTIWSRILATDANSDSFWIQIDNKPGIKVGDGGVTFGSWVWVNHNDGSEGNKITVNLTAGTHTLTIVGREANTKIDKILVTDNLSFVPSGLAGDEQSPSVSIIAPLEGEALFGQTGVQISATDDSGVEKVELFVDGTLAGSATVETAGTFTITWDTNKVPDGNHSLTAKAIDSVGNTSTSPAITVSVDNTVTDIQVRTLTLFNADTDQPIAGFDPMPESSTIDFSQFGTKNLSIVANTAPDNVGSVQFELDGQVIQTENLKPYAIVGDNSGNLISWTPLLGSHKLTVTPFTESGARGSSGIPVTVNFTVEDSGVSPPPAQQGDLNGDGKVDIFDMSLLLNNWGTNDSTADINGDGIVNIFDLSRLLSNWDG